jgi:hypothetical protein
MNITTYHPDGREVNEILIPESKNSNGTLFLDLAIRGWKLTFNKVLFFLDKEKAVPLFF